MKAGNLYLTMVPARMPMDVAESFGGEIVAVSHDSRTEILIYSEVNLLTVVVLIIS